MGLFDKKYCDICGEKIGLLGNRKLADGNLCKKCAAKLSPWFTGRKKSTVEDIREQLAYREENEAAVQTFNVTRTLGGRTKVLLDEDGCKFIITSSSAWRNENPDIIDFSQVTGCRVDSSESRHELKFKNKEGKDVSYNPPRYDYSYDFTMYIYVNHPYFDEVSFRLNDSDIDVLYSETGRGGSPDAILAGKAEYKEVMEIAEELKTAFSKIHEEVRGAVVEESVQPKAVVCPWCKATTIPDEKGCCEYCGGAIS